METPIGGAQVQNKYGAGITQTGTDFPGVGGAVTSNGMITQNGATPVTTQASPEAINAGIIGNTRPLVIPNIPVSTTAQGISGIADGVKQAGLKSQQDLAVQNDQAATNTSQNDYKSIIDQITGIQSNQSNIEDAAGLPTKATNLSDATNKLEASQRAQQNELRAVDQQAGISSEGAALQKEAINRKYAYEQADLALIQSAANRDYATAQSIVDRKVSLALEPLKTRADYLKTFYESNKADLTKAQDRQFQVAQNAAQREYDTKKEFETQKGSYALQALKDGNTELFKAINNATTPQEISNAVYNNTQPNGDNNKYQQIAQDIFQGSSGLTIANLPIAQRAGVTTELNKLKTAALKSGDIVGVIRASAGGQPVSDTFINSFQKALNVVGSLGDLKSSIQKVATGPVEGIASSNNPFDVKAKLMEAQLRSLVPNLARGIYGEVGVLTDNDVKNYAQTIASLTNTEDVNNALMGMTLKAVQRSLENQIKTQAGFGRDVSGILDTYNGVKATADSLSEPNTLETYNGVKLPQ